MLKSKGMFSDVGGNLLKNERGSDCKLYNWLIIINFGIRTD